MSGALALSVTALLFVAGPSRSLEPEEAGDYVAPAAARVDFSNVYIVSLRFDRVASAEVPTIARHYAATYGGVLEWVLVSARSFTIRLPNAETAARFKEAVRADDRVGLAVQDGDSGMELQVLPSTSPPRKSSKPKQKAQPAKGRTGRTRR